MSFEKPVVVIDNGSYNIKAGFSCDNHPVAMFRTVVGRPSYLNGGYGREYYDVHIGDEAVAKIDELDLNQPIVNGRIVHWDNMERIWHYLFYKELKVAPEDRSMMLACSAVSSMDEKLKCCEIIFETLNIPALCIQSQAVLSLYGSGYSTGISVDLGYDTADVCPVYEGGLIRYAHMQTNYAGAQFANFFKESLAEKNYHDFGIRTPEILEGMKRYLYITQDISMSRKDYKRIYTLPSGEKIDIGYEAFMGAEMIFQPRVIMGPNVNVIALQEAIVTAAMKCDADLRSELYEAVVLCGGMSMIPGLSTRLATEVEEITHKPVNILMTSEAYAVAWLGGATFAGMPASKQMWVTKKQYKDYGAKIVKNKFM